MASRTLATVILKGAPPLRPRARAEARPALVRSETSAKASGFLRFNCAKSRPNFYDAESLLLFRICDMRIGYETSWRRENLHRWNPVERREFGKTIVLSNGVLSGGHCRFSGRFRQVEFQPDKSDQIR